MIKRRSKDVGSNLSMVSPNRIAAPGSFSGARNPGDIADKKTVSSFQLRNQMFDQQLKDEIIMSKINKRKNETAPVVDVPKQGLTLNALKKHNQQDRLERQERRASGSEVPSTSRSSRSESSRKKSAYELEIILVEKQLQLKRLQAEQEKVSMDEYTHKSD